MAHRGRHRLAGRSCREKAARCLDELWALLDEVARGKGTAEDVPERAAHAAAAVHARPGARPALAHDAGEEGPASGDVDPVNAFEATENARDRRRHVCALPVRCPEVVPTLLRVRCGLRGRTSGRYRTDFIVLIRFAGRPRPVTGEEVAPESRDTEFLARADVPNSPVEEALDHGAEADVRGHAWV